MSPYVQTVVMLMASNCLMTYAWYGHLKNMSDRAWWVAAIVSWSIAFFEYMIAVPANRIGAQVYTIPQLKIIQEVVSLTIFIPFAVFYLNQPWKWDYLWAALCMMGAVYFIFRG